MRIKRIFEQMVFVFTLLRKWSQIKTEMRGRVVNKTFVLFDILQIAVFT